jgi:hypothetical protein
MAEIEWGVYSRSLPEHIPDDEILSIHVRALTKERNSMEASVGWQLRTDDARIKLKQLCPSILGCLTTSTQTTTQALTPA